MSHGVSGKYIAATIGLSLAASGTSGCSVFESGPELGPCYDTTQPLPAEPAYPEYEPNSAPDRPDFSAYEPTPAGSAALDQAISEYLAAADAYDAQYEAKVMAWHEAIDPTNIPVPVIDGIPEGDPIHLDEELSKRVASALVRISVGDAKGTGFITLNEKGEQVVITAAHVVIEAALSRIEITTNEGETTKPIGGCEIYENDGYIADPRTEEDSGGYRLDYDIAVLTLPNDLNATPIQIADTSPHPGTWIHLMNYQGVNGPAKQLNQYELYPWPAEYTGIVAPSRATDTAQNIIAGARDMGPNPTIDDFEEIHMVGGASGGPVINPEGKIVGVSVASTADNVYLTPPDISAVYDVNFWDADGKPDASFQPTAGTIMGIGSIEAVLTAPAAERAHSTEQPLQ